MLDLFTYAQPMTNEEARDWKERVGSHANGLRVLISEGYTREAWKALGYSNWTECVRAIADEYSLSERRIWQLQAANETELLLNNCSVGEIPEGQLRPLASLAPDQQIQAWKLAVETAPEGKITAAHVQSAVDTLTEKRPVSYHVSDDSYDWYTPQEYIEAARGVMGSIDLDPASSDKAQETVRAGEYYTKDNDGLSQEWFGNVWLNPPYNMPLIEQFIDRTIEEYTAGNIETAIILTNNSTDTGWFHKLVNHPFCLTRGRIRFENGEERLATRQGQALFYLGDNPDLFAKVFSAFGVVVKKYDNK
jgi:phage N-6-adenine-methyltransferase